MTDVKTWNEYGEELERQVRLKTFPLALKLLEKESDIPEGAKRPRKDFACRMNLCQSLQISRREGISMAMLIEDMWCHEPVLGFGLKEAPDYWLEGHSRYPRDVATLEAGSNYARELPVVETGRYVGLVSTPLKTANFEPDLVMIYCDSSQLSLLLLAREWKDGYNLKIPISSHAACVYGTVPAIQTGECQVAVPCRGDHYTAMAGDEEMIFTVPREKFGDLIEGLRYVEKTGSRLPRGYQFRSELPQSDAYEKIGEMMGLR